MLKNNFRDPNTSPLRIKYLSILSKYSFNVSADFVLTYPCARASILLFTRGSFEFKIRFYSVSSFNLANASTFS